MNRMAGKPGIAPHLPNSFDNIDFLFQPKYDPLWGGAKIGYPLLFHPIDGEENIYGGKERLGGALAAATNINNTLGFRSKPRPPPRNSSSPARWTNFRSWKLCCHIPAAAFPYIAGRIERGLVAKKFKLAHPFREYIRRFHYDSLAYYPETLQFMISLVGADRVVVGTDDYAPMDVEDFQTHSSRNSICRRKTAIGSCAACRPPFPPINKHSLSFRGAQRQRNLSFFALGSGAECNTVHERTKCFAY